MKILCLSLTTLLLAGGALAEEIVFEETLSTNAEPGDKVEVDNINGSITIETWDSDQVQVYYIVTCETQDEMDAITVNCQLDNGVSCDVDYDNDWDDCLEGEVSFFISVPTDIELEYSTDNVNGDISITGGSGSADIDLVNGDVQVESFTGTMTIEVVNGDVTAEDISELDAVDIVNGSIFVTVAELCSDLNIESVNGEIKVQLDTDALVEIDTMSGSIEIADGFNATVLENVVGASASFGSGDCVIAISTINGNIEID